MDEATFNQSRNFEQSNASLLRIIDKGEDNQNESRQTAQERAGFFQFQKKKSPGILLKVLVPIFIVLLGSAFVVYLLSASFIRNTNGITDFIYSTGNMGLGMVASVGFLVEQLSRDLDSSKPFGKPRATFSNLVDKAKIDDSVEFTRQALENVTGILQESFFND